MCAAPGAGYLGYVTGLSGVDLEKQKRGRMLAGIGFLCWGSRRFLCFWAARSASSAP
ncbi:cytochrome c biogenesis protein [Arthrobacter sp. Hiyo4]|nr:cytochrome c biogenesis protein [Arthrobacter sp. Hiyo4]